MPHEVIMPALGMSQDTGHLLAWHKSVGDTVEAGDILFEVETDKAAMEVEAGASGFVAELRISEGTEVPVGDVIAVITESKPDVALSEPPRPVEAEQIDDPQKDEARDDRDPPKPEPQPSNEPDRVEDRQTRQRVLASPKARRLASEKGIRLEDVAAPGRGEPLHAADIESHLAAPRSDVHYREIAIRLHSAPFDEFAAWCAKEAHVTLGRVWSAFAARAWRSGANWDGPVVVAYLSPGTALLTVSDPDVLPLSADIEPTRSTPHLIIDDWTGTRISRASPAGNAPAYLSLHRIGDDLELALRYGSRIDLDLAVRFLETLAARVADPLRQLL